MKLYCYLVWIWCWGARPTRAQEEFENILKQHDPYRFTTPLSRELPSGVTMKPAYGTPDYRVPERYLVEWVRTAWGRHRYRHEHRPYLMSPAYKAYDAWYYRNRWDNIQNIGCFCTTVYRRLTLLGGCAIITTRHILTTATSTHLILKDRLHYPKLENILGVWYDNDINTYNSSMYATPASIYYHPRWFYPESVNRSHPFSFHFDLSVWALTYKVYGWYLNSGSTYTCLRASAHTWEMVSPTPGDELYVIVGYQFMLAFDRNPMPWFKYAVRTRWPYVPCPKAEWGWFICFKDKGYAKFGLESGSGLHRTHQGYSWRYDGLVGLAAFSMRLRCDELLHYFTVLENHVVLDWLMDVYQSKNRFIWMDKRFKEYKGYAPVPKSKISRNYPRGVENYHKLLMNR